MTHGMSNTVEYYAWCSMIQRCENPKNPRYESYGARGITVCDRWRNSFEDFLADVGVKLFPELSLERINNDGNYEPGNTKWATRAEQILNRRTSFYPTGCLGVRIRNNGYQARIGLYGRMFDLGTYKTLQEAVEARKEAENW